MVGWNISQRAQEVTKSVIPIAGNTEGDQLQPELASQFTGSGVGDVAKSGVTIHASVNGNHRPAGDQEDCQEDSAQNREWVEGIAGC